MVVDCTAVETGCMLEKHIPGKGCNKIRVHFYFLVEVLLLLLRADAAAHNISTEAERGTTLSFLVAALLLLFTHREGCARTAGWSCSVFFSFSSNSLAKATW